MAVQLPLSPNPAHNPNPNPNANKDFERVNAAIAKEVESGGAAMVHC